jgi:outer membrane receptor protein involved in Fe transport
MGTLSFSSKALADPVAVEVPPQPLASALREFARQTGIQVAIPAELTDGKTSVAVKGKFEPADALNRLLKGSGLIAYPVNVNTYGIRSESTTGRTQGLSVRPIADAVSPADPSRRAQGNTTPTYHSSTETQDSGAPTEPTGESPALTEIIVTAQKRNERLQDVPVPVTAIAPAALVDSNQLRLQDYFTRVPGLMVTPDDEDGAPILAIRGITTGGYGNPAVGIVVDDVPFGSSSSNGLGDIAPDIDPFDLAQVEVLRGPQGTLYGAGSMGGLIKYSMVDPSTDGTSGRLQVGTATVKNGAEIGYNVRGAINVPLSDTLAIRASAFTREDPGYIDDPVHHLDGVNKHDAYGAHFSALWRPSEDLSLKLSAIYQNDKRFGSNDVYIEPGLGDLQQNALPGSGRFDKQLQAYAATLRAKVGAADVTSVTGYSINSFSHVLDDSSLAYYDGLNQSTYGASGTLQTSHAKTDKFSEEFRVSIPLAARIDWLLGVFYTHEDSSGGSAILAADAVSGQTAGQGFASSFPSTFEEYAAFTDLTYHFTSRFDVQFGLRESENRQTYNEVDTGIYVPAFDGGTSTTFVYPEQKSSGNALTYLVTPRLKLTPDLMVYARIASGYRPGGPNPGALLFGLPNQFGADKTQNYEIGVKADWLEHTLSVDASVYHIDWKDIQILVLDPVNEQGFYANGNKAKSQGVELSLNRGLFRALRFQGGLPGTMRS